MGEQVPLRVFVPLLPFPIYCGFVCFPFDTYFLHLWRTKRLKQVLCHFCIEKVKLFKSCHNFCLAGQIAACCNFWCRPCKENKENTCALLQSAVHFLLLTEKAWMFAQKQVISLKNLAYLKAFFSLLFKLLSLEYNFICYLFLGYLLFALDDSAEVNSSASLQIGWGEL